MIHASLAVFALLTLPALGALSPDVEPGRFDALEARLEGVPFGEEARVSLAQAEAFRAASSTRDLLALAGGDGAMAGSLEFTRPSDALAALAERHGAAVDLAELAALDSHPLARPLANVVDRFLLFEAAAQATYGPLAAQMPDLSADMEAAPTWTFEEAMAFTGQTRLPAADPSALAHLLDTRASLALAALDLSDAVRASQSSQAAAAPLVVAPVFALDLDGVDSYYPQDIVLTIDLGGNDLYENNAGGSNIDVLGLRCPPLPTGSFATGAGALIDLGAGNDRHESWRTCGVNGGGRLGAGFLYDEAGDDTYFASSGGVNGGGWAGLGFLYDGGAGSDNYTALASTGRLGVWGVNGGGMGHGQGFLLDEGGPDVYSAGVGGTNGGGYLQGGRGLLVDDGDGGDVYSADWLGTNGGANGEGAGALLDGGGDDTYLTSVYIAFGYGANGGAAVGAGLLYDEGGNDVYDALDAGTNGGAQAGVGLLIDEAGNDRYSGTGLITNGGANAGLGLLWDRAGSDSYTDGYGSCSDCSWVPKGLVGAQMDDSPR